MSRWQPDARGRMLDAALELFAEQGYDRTTAGDIATRAGVTERTFFRHFADKREVLFAGPVLLDEVVVETVGAVDPEAAPWPVAIAAVREAAARLGAARTPAQAAQRARIVAQTPALQERELLKMASMTSAIAAALVGRGVAEPLANLAAHSAVAVFSAAFARWASGEEDRPFEQCVDEAASALRELT
ncbi:transcriptional regulator, TetR family [Nocardioides terrae]|uniref:Transcriptional regulator, TetR family n=1 Tax=Nocardioides terrae TaxID=574651 RepID=A0A1I1EUT4_9ACTN|nr:helix-turn-helix domain-containing protein [Nocardioides terrae]SFB90854.1 transcriptional regulator, TetR family [Nocardioides terrae]